MVVTLASPATFAAAPTAKNASAQMVITARPADGGEKSPRVEANDLIVTGGNAPAPVVRLERLSGDLASMQLFIFLDDSTRSSSLSTHFDELKAFIESLPPTTEVAIGYMQTGTFALQQAFTTDHEKAAGSLRLPLAMPGENGSPYFALSDLVKRWPSKEPVRRRAVLMLTDGIDRYYGPQTIDDPYVDNAIRSAVKDGVMVYSIYVRGAGLYGRNDWVTNMGQSHLIQVTEQTGGYAYFEAYTDPVTIAPFLYDLQERLENQYAVTIEASVKGLQSIKLRSAVPGLKLSGPTRVYAQ